MTSEAEIRLMNLFRECYNEFPPGNLLKTMPPSTDFMLYTDSGPTIGIELTEALHSEKSREISNVTYNFTNLIVAELQKELSFTFSIDIDLNPAISIPKSNRATLVSQTVKKCIEEFSDLQHNEHRSIEHIAINLSEIAINRPEVLLMILSKGYRNLPIGINRIRMSRWDGLKQSWNMQGEGGAVPNFTDDYLIAILDKKEKKIMQYTPCDEFWLVITEGNYFTGSFDAIKIQVPIKTSFDKVFLLRCNERAITRLK